MARMRLLIATYNQGKKAELAELLRDLDFALVTLNDLGVHEVLAENGNTYAENALIKAKGYAAITRLLTLADDSGLEVDALGGAPGVLTARYAGEDASDEERYWLLLRNLQGVPDERRTARFRCAIALAWPDGRTRTVEGTCEGRIAHEPRGAHGFGYDPIFYLPEFGCTMAQLPQEMKNRISHRARAATAARTVLKLELAASSGEHADA